MAAKKEMIVDLKEAKEKLLAELGQVAAKEVCLNRLCKMEELHKRINAIDRSLGEEPPKETL